MAVKEQTKPKIIKPKDHKELTILDIEDDEKISFDWEVTTRLLSYLEPYRRNLSIAVFAMLFSVSANVLGPPLIGWAIDEGIRKHDMSIVAIGVFIFVMIQIVGLIGFRIQLHHMATTGQNIIQTIRDELFDHIQYLSINFFAKYEAGRLIARVVSDVNVLREAITFAVVGSIREVLTLGGIIIAMTLINAQLTLVAVIVLIVLGVIANYWRIYAREAYLKVSDSNAKVNAELSEAFNGVRVTQAFDRQKFNYHRFTDNINMENRDANVRASFISSLFFPSIELVGGVATGVLIYVGGSLVLENNLTVGVLLAFILYINQFFFPIRMLAQRYNLFQAVMASGYKIFKLMDFPIDIEDSENAGVLPDIEGHVRFEDVSFQYSPDSEMVLKNINLDIPAGSTVAFVGHTGAGKTTMVKLIMRFYDTIEGKVTVDDYNLKEVTQNSLRRQIGVVPQDTNLFAGTVMDNIRYGRLDATDEEVIEAAKAVGAHDFISNLEGAYQSDIMEGGAVLSTGQRQLLAFARALLADPRILILDEATSNIDTQTERLIQTALERLLIGRTSFVIAHRLSTITTADLIVVMDHGEIIETGNHQELLALEGVYHKLFTMV